MTDTTWDLQQHTPETLWAACCLNLTTAAQSARHPFHLVTVATVTADGRPSMRTVVLRAFHDAPPAIAFHTDNRSPKFQHLSERPDLSLHWYAPDLRVQLRAHARATLHQAAPRATQSWEQSRVTSRACYTAADPPGTPVANFPPAPAIPLDDDMAGLVHFAVVSCRFTELEVLALHASGHQRVRLSLATTPPSWQILAP